jgi:hypothetical protein
MPDRAARFRLIALALLGACLSTAPARACPPGHYAIGGGTGGWEGCAPMDGGVGAGEGNSLPSIEDMNVTLPGLSTYDAKAWVNFFEEMAQSQIETEREIYGKKNPEAYEALLRGTWFFTRSNPEDKIQICMADFMRRRGGIRLMHWDGDEPGTFLAFFGDNIQRVGKVKRIRVRLVQGGESQTVEVFQTNYPLSKYMGMLMFRVPSTEALLNAIEDNQDFKIFMDQSDIEMREGLGRVLLKPKGQKGVEHEIFTPGWHTGHAARDALKACIRERRTAAR